jgi:hypothetical protein
MNFNLIISGLAGTVVGGFCYLVMSNPSYAGSAGEGLGQYLLWLFALATIVSLLVAVYGFVSGGKAVSK